MEDVVLVLVLDVDEVELVLVLDVDEVEDVVLVLVLDVDGVVVEDVVLVLVVDVNEVVVLVLIFLGQGMMAFFKIFKSVIFSDPGFKQISLILIFTTTNSSRMNIFMFIFCHTKSLRRSLVYP